jgi:uncharacterized membrane protein
MTMSIPATPAVPPHGLPALWEKLTGPQRRAIARVLLGRRLPRDVDSEFADTRTFGQRVSDRIAAFGGSWPFIGLAFLFLAAWVVLNSVLLARRGTAFDPYPYILLNLFLSMLAALQAPIIMMSQNRQEDKDRFRAENDYLINLKAELEIRHLQQKVDHLLMSQWQRMMKVQEVQMQLLEELVPNHRTRT